MLERVAVLAAMFFGSGLIGLAGAALWAIAVERLIVAFRIKAALIRFIRDERKKRRAATSAEKEPK